MKPNVPILVIEMNASRTQIDEATFLVMHEVAKEIGIPVADLIRAAMVDWLAHRGIRR